MSQFKVRKILDSKYITFNGIIFTSSISREESVKSSLNDPEKLKGKLSSGDQDTVEEALKDSAHLHGKDGSLDLIGNLYTFNDINNRYDTRGWPDFPWWPNAQQMSHMGFIVSFDRNLMKIKHFPP